MAIKRHEKVWNLLLMKKPGLSLRLRIRVDSNKNINYITPEER